MTLLSNHTDFEAMLRPRRPTEDGFLGEYSPYVAVAFGAGWCPPCRAMDKEFIAKSSPRVRWYYCDVDLNEVTLGYCGLNSIPSFVLIKDGNFTDRLSSAGNATAVLEWLVKHGVPVTTTTK